MTELLTVHLTTDRCTGDLVIDFDPDEDSHTPVPVDEWPDLRTFLRGYVEGRIACQQGWEACLHSNRIGERLDVAIGALELDDEGHIEADHIRKRTPADVEW